MSKGQAYKIEHVDSRIAREVAIVGIMPSNTDDQPGYQFKLAGQPFIVTGRTTRQAFLARLHETGLYEAAFEQVPTHYYFLTVNTD